MANDLKLKGPVREIGIVRDNDRHDSFNITIGITIKTEGKVSYEEAERLSTSSAVSTSAKMSSSLRQHPLPRMR